MLHRVFAGCLPSTKHWYALNNEICSVRPQRFCESKVFELFPEEIRSLPLDDLHGENGAKVPAHIFNGGKSKIHVFVGTTFAILIACLRRKDPGNADLLKDANFTQIISQIDSMNLEELLTRQKRPQFPETPPQTPPTTPPSSSPYSLFPPSTFENCSPEVKKRKIRERLFGLYNLIEIVATENGESLSTVVSKCCLLEKERRIKAIEKPSSMIQEVISTVCSEKGLAQGFNQLIASETWESFVQTQKVPDWQLLLCKLETLLSDDGWQKVLNRTNIGFSGKSADIGIFLSKTNIKAIRSLVFQITEELMDIRTIPDADITGYQVSLSSIVVWLARQLQLHGKLENHLQLNLKLDGRPFFDMNKVAYKFNTLCIVQERFYNHS